MVVASHRQTKDALERQSRQGVGSGPAGQGSPLGVVNRAANNLPSARLLRDSKKVRVSPAMIGLEVLQGAEFDALVNHYVVLWIKADFASQIAGDGIEYPSGQIQLTASWRLMDAATLTGGFGSDDVQLEGVVYEYMNDGQGLFKSGSFGYAVAFITMTLPPEGSTKEPELTLASPFDLTAPAEVLTELPYRFSYIMPDLSFGIGYPALQV
jgi:hypothetical protein